MDFDDFEVHAERHYRKLEEIIGISFSGDPYRMNQSRITTEVIEIALGPNGEYGVCYSFVSTDGVSVYSILGVVSQDENTNPKAFDTMRRIMNSFVITPSGAN